MTKITAAITAINGYVPPDLLTNKDLELLVDTSDEWITSRTGISERHILKDPSLATSDMAVEAVNGLLKKRGIGADEIELIIFATVTPDLIFPSSACILADKIGAKNAFAFDLMAACSGFLFSLQTASSYIESGKYKKVLVVGADKMSSIIDYTDRNTCIIFGDGCGAVLLEPNYEGNGIIDAVLKSDGSGRHFLHQKAGGSFKTTYSRNSRSQRALCISRRQASFQICRYWYGRCFSSNNGKKPPFFGRYFLARATSS
jgi:3-oxoacyl-[acyl-carrier-protein] synthase-3